MGTYKPQLERHENMQTGWKDDEILQTTENKKHECPQKNIETLETSTKEHRTKNHERL